MFFSSSNMFNKKIVKIIIREELTKISKSEFDSFLMKFFIFALNNNIFRY